MDKHPLKKRFNNLNQRMMHHPIPVGSRADEPYLGLKNKEFLVGTRSVGKIFQLGFEAE
jgi:hypothetical protein